MKYIDSEKLIELVKERRSKQMGFAWDAVNEVLKIITSLQQEQPEVDFNNIDSRVQYASIDAAVKAFAETYSFNIESKLFNQLSGEQQELWRTEIEQAVINGGEVGLELAKDTRYRELNAKKED